MWFIHWENTMLSDSNTFPMLSMCMTLFCFIHTRFMMLVCLLGAPFLLFNGGTDWETTYLDYGVWVIFSMLIPLATRAIFFCSNYFLRLEINFHVLFQYLSETWHVTSSLKYWPTALCTIFWAMKSLFSIILGLGPQGHSPDFLPVMSFCLPRECYIWNNYMYIYPFNIPGNICS